MGDKGKEDKKIIEHKDIKDMRVHNVRWIAFLIFYFYVAKNDESISCELGDSKLEPTLLLSEGYVEMSEDEDN